MNTGRILKQGSWYLLGNLATRAAFIAATLVFTRLFVPEAFGAFVLVKTAVVFAAALDTWLIECVMRFRPQAASSNRLDEFSRLLGSLAAFQIVAVAVPALIILGSSEGSWVVLGRYALAIYLLDFSYRLNLQLLRVRGCVGAYNGYSLVYAVSRLLCSLLLIFTWKQEITALLWAWIGVAACLLPPMSISAWRLPRERIPQETGPVTGESLSFRDMAAYGMPFVGLALGWTGLYLADRFMLQYFRGSAEVGLYGVNYSFAELAHFLPYMLISFPAYPALIRMWESHGFGAVQDSVCRLARPYLLLALPLIAGTALAAPRLLTLCTTPAYASAASAIAWMAPGLLAWGLLAFLNIPFMVLKRTRLLASLGLGALAVNVLLNLLVIPKYGIYGASAATSATYILLAAGAWWTGARVLRAPIQLPWETVCNAVLATLGMLAVLIPLSAPFPEGWTGLLLLVTAGGAIYGTGLLTLREFSSADLETVTRHLPLRAKVQEA